MVLAVLLIVLSPTVWVDIIHKDEVQAVKTAVGGLDSMAKQGQLRIDDLQKQLTVAAGINNRNAAIETAISIEKSSLADIEAKKAEANTAMPAAIVKYKNPGLFSMFAAFFVGILMSLLWPEKEAAAKYADLKLREYAGIGAE
jgi:hypothetical protein